MQTWSVAVGSWPPPAPSQFAASNHDVVPAPPSHDLVHDGGAALATDATPTAAIDPTRTAAARAARVGRTGPARSARTRLAAVAAADIFSLPGQLGTASHANSDVDTGHDGRR